MRSSTGLSGLLKRTAAAALAAGVVLCAVGCGHKENSGELTLRWCVDPNPIRKEQIKLFESKNPKLHVINDPGADAQKLLTQLAGDVPPDIMALYDPQTIRLFARKGALLDLRPYIKKYHVDMSRFWPQLRPYIYYQNKVVGFPDNCGPYVMFYNKRLVREAGLPYPKPGWTWDDCLKMSQKLTRFDKDRGKPVQFGLYVGTWDWWFFIWKEGGHLFSPDGKRCVIDSEEAKKGIRFWYDLRHKYHVIPTSSEAQSMAPTGGWGNDALLFRAQKIAMTVCGRWIAIQYREQKDLDWDVAPLPVGKQPITLLASKTYAIPASCRHKEEAFKYLLHLISKDDELLVGNYGDGIPSIQDIGRSPQFLFNPEYPNERNNKVHLDQMQHARVQEWSPYISLLDTNAIMSEEFDMMWQKQETADQACDRIARRINMIIKRNLNNTNFLD